MTKKKIFTFFLIFAGLQPLLIEKILAKQVISAPGDKQEINLNESRKERRRTVVYARPQLNDSDRKKIFKNKATGTRGENNSIEEEQITILAPNELAKTISAHPTFYVYAPKAQTKLMILIEDSDRIIWEQYLQVEKAGIIELSLPSDKEGLKPGQDYRFVVSEVIDSKDRSRDLVAQIWVNFSELNQIQKQELARLNDPKDRGVFLARNSIWFDSVEYFRDSQSFQLLHKMLAAVGLENIPVAERKG